MKKNRIRLTESQLHNLIKESARQILSELDWKTYANAAKKRYSQGDFDKFHDLRRASEDAFNKKYGYNDEWDADLQHGGERKVYMQGTGENYSEPTLRASKSDRYPSLYGAYKSVGSTLSHNKKGDYVYGSHHQSCDDGHWSSNNTDDFDFGPDEVFRGKYGAAKREFDRYDNDNYEYEPNGRGWYLKDNMDEAIRRAIRKVLS